MYSVAAKGRWRMMGMLLLANERCQCAWGLLDVMHLARQATKGRQVLAFYSLPEYEAWKEAAGPGWSIKYYKGLGTSTEAEAKDYFAAIDSHRKAFVWEGARFLTAPLP